MQVHLRYRDTGRGQVKLLLKAVVERPIALEMGWNRLDSVQRYSLSFTCLPTLQKEVRRNTIRNWRAQQERTVGEGSVVPLMTIAVCPHLCLQLEQGAFQGDFFQKSPGNVAFLGLEAIH